MSFKLFKVYLLKRYKSKQIELVKRAATNKELYSITGAFTVNIFHVSRSGWLMGSAANAEKVIGILET